MSDWERPPVHSPDPVGWEETKLYNRWRKQVATGRANDFVLAISASSHTGVSGTGKTTCATALAEEFDLAGGFDAEAHGSINLNEFAYDILPTAPEGSALLLEEAQGTPSGTGLNKRRGMKDESLAAINGILANRDNRYTVIIVMQQLSMLDTSLIPLLDAWLLIRYEPDDVRGPMLTHHKVYGEDYRLKVEDLKTPAEEDLRWPPLGPDNDNYQIMEQKKQAAKQRGGDDDDDEIFTKDDLPTDLRDDIVAWAYDLSDEVTQKEVAEEWGLTQQRLQQIV